MTVNEVVKVVVVVGNCCVMVVAGDGDDDDDRWSVVEIDDGGWRLGASVCGRQLRWPSAAMAID